MYFRIWYGKQAKRGWKWTDNLNSLYFMQNNRNWNWAPCNHLAFQNPKIILNFFLLSKGPWEFFYDLTCHEYICELSCQVIMFVICLFICSFLWFSKEKYDQNKRNFLLGELSQRIKENKTLIVLFIVLISESLPQFMYTLSI